MMIEVAANRVLITRPIEMPTSLQGVSLRMAATPVDVV